MAQNLKISNYTLTPSDSDVDSNYTLPASNLTGFADDNVANVYINSNYGGYYTWTAVTAGKGNNSITSGDIASSICPVGWDLPNMSDFQTLVNNYDYSTITRQPANFAFTGVFYRNSAQNSGNDEFYSSTANNNGVYQLQISSNSFSLYGGDNKTDGDPVRCVSKYR